MMLLFLDERSGVRKEKDGEILKSEASKSSENRLIPVILDVTKQNEIDDCHKFIESELKRNNIKLVGLINNAGIGCSGIIN